MTPESFVIIFGALALGAFAKGMTGLGLPPVSIAILAVFFGVEHAIVVTTIPVAFSNVQIVWMWLRAGWDSGPGCSSASTNAC